MAITDLSLGYVYRPEEIIITSGTLNAASVRRLYEQVDNLTRAFNGSISLGDASTPGSKAGNFDAVYAQAVSPAANVEFTVKHELGRVPSGFDVVFRDKAGVVYASRAQSWTESTIYLKCSTATTTIRVRLF